LRALILPLLKQISYAAKDLRSLAGWAVLPSWKRGFGRTNCFKNLLLIKLRNVGQVLACGGVRHRNC
jgi:hypothetical protein